MQRGYEVDIITCNTEKTLAYEELDGIHIYRLSCWNALNSTYPIPKPCLTNFRILRMFLRKKYDIINTQTRFFISSFLGLIFAKVKRVPLLHTEHGARHSVVSSKVINLISRAYDHTIGTLIVKSAKRTIGVSEAACEFLKHLGATNTKLIYNGIDTSIFRRRDTNYREKLRLGNDATLITLVGRLIYAKGIQDLISVFPEIASKHEVRLLIVGDGAYKPELEKLAQNKGNILFLGQKEQGEVIEILNSSDIFVNPSYSEGLPTSVLEAGAAGLAIVATDVGGTKEIINDGNTGFLVPPTDKEILKEKICQLIENKKLRGAFGRNIHKYVKDKFDWDEITEKWIKEVGS